MDAHALYSLESGCWACFVLWCSFVRSTILSLKITVLICKRRLQVYYPKASEQMPNPGLPIIFFKFYIYINLWILGSDDGVSRLSLSLETSLETHFCESRSRMFQLSSRSRRLHVSVTAYCHELLNIAKKWLGKTSIVQRIFVSCVCR